jgi:hypothetical protein
MRSRCACAPAFCSLCAHFMGAPAIPPAVVRRRRIYPEHALRPLHSREACCSCAGLVPLPSALFARRQLLPPTPQGSSARRRPTRPPAHTNLLCSLSFGDSTNSSPSSSPPPPTRRLRPAGQRPASRRLSRSPSAPERTIHVLHRRRWGRTAVLSGAEAARRSHKRLAGRRPSSATLRPFFSRAAPVICSISSRARRGKYKREVRFGLSLTRNSCSAFIHAVQPRPGTAPMPRMCRGPPNAASPRAAPRRRRQTARHPRVRPDVRLLPLVVCPLSVPFALWQPLTPLLALASLSFSLSSRAYARW